MPKNVSEIRIYPISSFDYPTEEYAKMCIANGFENYSSFSDLGNDRGYLDLYNRTLFLFQYNAKIIAKGNVCLNYTDEIEILDEPVTAMDIKGVWQDFKKFNSAAQKIPTKHLSAILELFNQKEKTKTLLLSENESFFLNHEEGKKIEYFVTKYERNPIYREQAIKIHGLVCQTCGFDFEKTYGRLGEGYIEVHHKKPLFSLDSVIVPNPSTDMICVCSNCHRMLHRHRDSIISPEELKEILNMQKAIR